MLGQTPLHIVGHKKGYLLAALEPLLKVGCGIGLLVYLVAGGVLLVVGHEQCTAVIGHNFMQSLLNGGIKLTLRSGVVQAFKYLGCRLQIAAA